MIYRVVYCPTVFPRWRDFSSRAEAETYRGRIVKHDPHAEIVELEGTDATGGTR